MGTRVLDILSGDTLILKLFQKIIAATSKGIISERKSVRINYLGHAAIKIKSRKTSVVVDPFSKESVGFPMKKTKAQIVVCTHEHADHASLEGVKNESPFLIKAPGEYELHEVFIKGIESYHDKKKGKERGKNTIFIIKAEGVSICHLGDLGCSLTEKQIDQINGVDVLLIPVGGFYTIGPEEAVKVIGQIEPSIVIPVHFKTKDHKIEKLEPIDVFLKEVGGKVREEERLVISKGSLPEETEVVVLKY